jgi:hypothetical protein
LKWGGRGEVALAETSVFCYTVGMSTGGSSKETVKRYVESQKDKEMQKRAYRYRFYPTNEQAQNLAHTFGCTRFVYNWALNQRKRAYFDQRVKLSTKDVSAALTALKKEEGTAWLKCVSSVPLQQALRYLDAAYTNFFEGRTGYPPSKRSITSNPPRTPTTRLP